MSGTKFFRANLNVFFEFQKKKFFATSVSLKMTIKKYFFVKKNLVKKTPIKFVEIFCQNKRASGWRLLTMKSMCKNTSFLEKRPDLFQETWGKCFIRHNDIFFWTFWKKINYPQALPSKWHFLKNFFLKKTCQKNLPIKFVKKNCQKKIENQLFFQKNIKEWSFWG